MEEKYKMIVTIAVIKNTYKETIRTPNATQVNRHFGYFDTIGIRSKIR